MYALELPAMVDEHQQIHVQLPAHVHAKQVRVLVMYEQESAHQAKPSLIQMLMQMPNVGDDADFCRVQDQDHPDVFA